MEFRLNDPVDSGNLQSCELETKESHLHHLGIDFVANGKNVAGIICTWNLFNRCFGGSKNPSKEGPNSTQNGRVIKGFQGYTDFVP